MEEERLAMIRITAANIAVKIEILRLQNVTMITL
jgi:hypothetical protein